MFQKLKMWLFGTESEARRLAERHLPTASVGLPVEQQGDRQDDMDGRRIGGVIWPVEQGTHGLVSFLTADTFLAEYVQKDKKVYMMDDLANGRHPGAKPLTIGLDVDVLEDVGGYGFVMRSPEFGEEGLYNNIFVPFKGAIEAHHIPPDQPKNSTPVYDEDGRKGGLHYALRVREWVRRLCSGATQASADGDEDIPYAPLLNFGTNGDGTPAYGATHFDRAEACLSDEAFGPLGPADDGQHRLGVTGEATIHQGGLNISRTLWGDSALEIIYSPAHFNPAQLPTRLRGPFPMFVEWREDYNRRHRNYCGKEAVGEKDWFAESLFGEYVPPTYPPPGYPPNDPPGDPPHIPSPIKPPEPPGGGPPGGGPPGGGPPGGGPPGGGGGGGGIIGGGGGANGPITGDPPNVIGPNVPGWPPEWDDPPGAFPPTAGSPYETETPSDYDHPMPAIPDGKPLYQGNPTAARAYIAGYSASYGFGGRGA